MNGLLNYYLEDYEFVIDTINNIHPLALEEFPVSFTNQIISSEKKISDKRTLINALSKTTTSLMDAHTNIELPFSKNDFALNFSCRWYEDCLYVISDNKFLKSGDKIVSINNILLQNYFEYLTAYIPHENQNIIRSRTTQYPYQNYYLFSALNLQNYFGNITEYIIGYERDDNFCQTKATLQEYNGSCDFVDLNDFISLYYIDNIAFIRMDECKYNQEYVDKLNEYFKDISDKKVSKLVLDLSENMGGNSNVTQEFLRHMDVKNYYFYEIYIRDDHSEIVRNVSKRDCLIENDRYRENLFSGDLYCLISNTTFSSARIFATVLQDNNIAKLIGENSGGKPTSFGAPTKFTTPNNNIKFRISARKFYRPDINKDADLFLVPNIRIIQSYQTRNRMVQYNKILKYLV